MSAFNPYIRAIALASVIGITACGDTSQSASSVAENAAELTSEQKFAASLKGAEMGDAKAQFSLGWMYQTGEGAPKDAANAVKWYQKAADQGLASAQNNLGVMYLVGGEGLSKDAAKAADWFQKAADQGLASAQESLGGMYESGEGVPKDVEKAADWIKKAANQGLASAQTGLGRMYFHGIGVPKDVAKAADWIQKAADQGLASAQTDLGRMYFHGRGVPKNFGKAAEWFQKAAIQGDALGQNNLAVMYNTGSGVPIDRVLAYAWFNLAAAQGDEDSIVPRNWLEQRLSPRDLQEATRLSSNWKQGQAIFRENAIAAAGSATGGGARAMQGTGTVFVVNKSGYAITNQHVVNGCAELRIAGHDGTAKLVTDDKVNDLALLQIPGTIKATPTIAREPQTLRQGEDIVVFGYPLSFVLSSGGNLTPGVVSALTGLGNNTNQIQITAPIQPGSSGSPVLNKKGEIIGVVSMKLSDKEMAKTTGQVAQSVNFAVSGQTLKSFLDTHKVNYRTGGFVSFDKSTTDLADEARNWTMVVECWR